MRIINKATILLLASLAIVGCKKDDDPNPQDIGYEVPTTYSFENVNYSGQTARIKMLTELVNYAKSGNAGEVDAQKLRDMFANQNNPFSNPDLNANTKDLKSKCFNLFTDEVDSYFNKLAVASQSTQPGSNGVAGVVTSGTKSYLCDENGVEYAQVIAKSLMGAVLYYQATSIYLSDEGVGAGVNNENVTPGKGTTMEHHWDEAFGYLGVPLNFPANTNDINFWGEYAVKRNSVLNNSSTLMNAFIKGRAAISNKDYTTRDEQRAIIKTEWEKICAASVVHYINTAKSSITNDAVRNHQLSECLGFLNSLAFSADRKITNAKLDELKAKLGTNFYEVSIDNLNYIKEELSNIYGFNTVKDTL